MQSILQVKDAQSKCEICVSHSVSYSYFMSRLMSVILRDSVIHFSDTVKILGATLDSSLRMGPHIKVTSKSFFQTIATNVIVNQIFI